MKTKKSLLALALVSLFTLSLFAATTIEANDNDKRIAIEKTKKPKPSNA